MQTTCPTCQTVFNISKKALETDDGEVICSICTTQFNAYDSLDESDSIAVKTSTHHLAKPILFLLLFTTFLLPIQYLYFQKELLLQQPSIRNIAEMLCNFTPCQLKPFRAPEQIQLINRKVHSHPVEANALIITATVINNAPQAQPFPKLLIGMADIHGKVHAQRLFTPSEYLPENMSAEQTMTAGIPLNINLEIQDPGKDLIVFEIDFL